MVLTVLGNLFAPANFFLMFIGVPIGIIFGAIPGLNATTAMALFLPLTFALDSSGAIAFMGGIYVGGCSGGLIASTLLNVPGSPANIATCFDGYPMAKGGRASRALGIGIFSSFLATIGSLIIAMILTAPIAKIAVLLGPWEYFALCTAAILLVITISKGEMFTGLISACLGIMLAMVGIAPVDGAKRFTFGTKTLLGGFPMLALMLGVFAIAGLLESFSDGVVFDKELDTGKIKGIGIPLKEYFAHWKLIIKSFLIGLWIGFLPGMGGGLSNIVSYAMAKSSSSHPEKFGTGCDEGIIASEVANNASIGGAIIPTIALGIPGDTSCAILLSCLIIQGIQSGPMLLNTNTDLVYLFYAVLLAGNIITFVLELGGIRTFPYILRVPIHYLYPAIFTMCLVGSYTDTFSISSIYFTAIMTLVGIFMIYGHASMSPFILGYILGPMMEEYMRQGMTYSKNGFLIFFQRPVSCALLIIAFASLVWPFIRDARAKRRAASGRMTDVEKAELEANKFGVRED